MSTVRLLTDPISSRQSANLLQAAAERVEAGRADSFLYVVPSERKVQELRRALIARSRGAIPEPHLVTPNGLVNSLYRRLQGPGRLISRAEKLVLIEQVLLDRSLGLSYWSPGGRRPFPGLLHELGELIAELKQNLVSPDGLLKRLAALGAGRSRRDRELHRIYERYQQLLTEHELIDTDGMFWVLLEQARDQASFREPLRGVELCILDGIYDVTVAEERVLVELSRVVPETWVHLAHDAGNERLFEASKSFCQLWRSGEERAQSSASAEPAVLDRLAVELFRAPERGRQKVPLNGFITLTPANDRLEEVRAIARRIRQLVKEEPPVGQERLELSRVCVAFPDLRAYAPLIREIFPRYGIPFSLHGGVPLTASPLVASVLAIFSIIESRYHRRQVLRFLGSPYVRYRASSGEELDAARLERLTREAQIIDARPSWSQRLQALAAGQKAALAGAPSPEDRERLNNEIAATGQTAQAVEEALGEMAALEQPMSLPQFRDALLRLIDRFELPQQAMAPLERASGEADEAARRELVAADLSALNGLYQVLEALILASRLSPQLRAEKLELVELKNLLVAALAAETFVGHQPHALGVQVVDLLGMRGLAFDVVFLGGLAEGAMPAPPPPSIFFSESERRKLGLKVEPRRLAVERYLFYLALTAARRHVWLSYPKAEGEEPLLRSSFLEELDRVAEFAEIESQPALPPASQQELDLALGSGLLQDAPKEPPVPLAAYQGALSSEQAERWQNVLRAARAEDLRWRQPWATEFDGVVRSPELIERIARQFGPPYLFTISNLETYARCPFRFFAAKLLGLLVPEEPEEELLPWQMGQIVHNILRSFFTERARPGEPVILARENLDEALARLRALAEREFARHPHQDLFWQAEKDRMIGRSDGSGLPGVLELFLQHEAGSARRCRPSFFEVPFGPEGAPGRAGSALRLEPLLLTRDGAQSSGPVRVIGRIDRIDADDPATPTVLVVVDYKSGSVPSRGDIGSGLSLQLPLYIGAVRRHFPRAALVGGGYIQLKRLAEVGREPTLVPNELARDWSDSDTRLDAASLDELVGQTLSRAIGHVADLRAGRFPLTSLSEREAKCSSCPYHGICRFDELRQARRTADPTLQQLPQNCPAGGNRPMILP